MKRKTKRASPSPELEREQAQQNFFELVGEFDDAMLITHGPDGDMHARPMSIARIEDDGDLWFVTHIDSTKVEELTKSSRVLVAMQAPRRFASINGRAELVRDRTKIEELWSEAFRLYWKDAHDPSIALIRVRAEEGEYWDESGISGLKFAFRAATALLSGEQMQRGPSGSGKPGDPGDDVDVHAKVKL
jgi:general stress protein 26